MKTLLTTLLLTLTLLLTACGSSSQTLLLADQTIETPANTEVTVPATEGADSYRWRQLSGISVEISDPEGRTLAFTAPSVTQEERLLFELNASFGDVTQTAEVTVIVHPLTGGDDNGTTDGNDDNSTDGDDTNTTTPDTTPPILTLNGESNITLTLGETYTELGATAMDERDGRLSVAIIGDVNSSQVGSYTLTYRATDHAGNEASVRRTVSVQERIYPPTITLTESQARTLLSTTIPYDHITLEINATSTVILTALNQTLTDEQNRTIRVIGSKSGESYYLYNVPLVKGTNTIRLQATNRADEMVEKRITIHADANQSVPLAMRATVYAGVQRLDTTVEVGTIDLNITEYLFDVESDGKIDTIQNDANFTLHLTDEGRYRPRVTVRTAEGLLYSSGDYALSLDVRASAEQKDPMGARPVDIAKRFQGIVLSNDRASVERLVGSNPQLLHMLYGNPYAIPLLEDIYRSIKTWHVKKWDIDGRASVSYTFEINGTTYGGGMELKLIDAQVKTGREWIIDFIY